MRHPKGCLILRVFLTFFLTLTVALADYPPCKSAGALNSLFVAKDGRLLVNGGKGKYCVAVASDNAKYAAYWEKKGPSSLSPQGVATVSRFLKSQGRSFATPANAPQPVRSTLLDSPRPKSETKPKAPAKPGTVSSGGNPFISGPDPRTISTPGTMPELSTIVTTGTTGGGSPKGTSGGGGGSGGGSGGGGGNSGNSGQGNNGGGTMMIVPMTTTGGSIGGIAGVTGSASISATGDFSGTATTSSSSSSSSSGTISSSSSSSSGTISSSSSSTGSTGGQAKTKQLPSTPPTTPPTAPPTPVPVMCPEKVNLIGARVVIRNAKGACIEVALNGDKNLMDVSTGKAIDDPSVHDAAFEYLKKQGIGKAFQSSDSARYLCQELSRRISAGSLKKEEMAALVGKDPIKLSGELYSRIAQTDCAPYIQLDFNAPREPSTYLAENDLTIVHSTPFGPIVEKIFPSNKTLDQFSPSDQTKLSDALCKNFERVNAATVNWFLNSKTEIPQVCVEPMVTAFERDPKLLEAVGKVPGRVAELNRKMLGGKYIRDNKGRLTLTRRNNDTPNVFFEEGRLLYLDKDGKSSELTFKCGMKSDSKIPLSTQILDVAAENLLRDQTKLSDLFYSDVSEAGKCSDNGIRDQECYQGINAPTLEKCFTPAMVKRDNPQCITKGEMRLYAIGATFSKRDSLYKGKEPGYVGGKWDDFLGGIADKNVQAKLGVAFLCAKSTDMRLDKPEDLAAVEAKACKRACSLAETLAMPDKYYGGFQNLKEAINNLFVLARSEASQVCPNIRKPNSTELSGKLSTTTTDSDGDNTEKWGEQYFFYTRALAYKSLGDTEKAKEWGKKAADFVVDSKGDTRSWWGSFNHTFGQSANALAIAATIGEGDKSGKAALAQFDKNVGTTFKIFGYRMSEVGDEREGSARTLVTYLAKYQSEQVQNGKASAQTAENLISALNLAYKFLPSTLSFSNVPSGSPHYKGGRQGVHYATPNLPYFLSALRLAESPTFDPSPNLKQNVRTSRGKVLANLLAEGDDKDGTNTQTNYIWMNKQIAKGNMILALLSGIETCNGKEPQTWKVMTQPNRGLSTPLAGGTPALPAEKKDERFLPLNKNSERAATSDKKAHKEGDRAL